MDINDLRGQILLEHFKGIDIHFHMIMLLHILLTPTPLGIP